MPLAILTKPHLLPNPAYRETNLRFSTPVDMLRVYTPPMSDANLPYRRSLRPPPPPAAKPDQMSKTTMSLVNITDTSASVQALLDSRTYVDLSPLEPKPVAMSGPFVFIEQVIYTPSTDAGLAPFRFGLACFPRASHLSVCSRGLAYTPSSPTPFHSF